MRGLFITFEGIEGCGKTTQIRLLEDHLKRKNLEVILTREPGGTPIGDKIRAILLDATNSNMAPIAELLLYAAARNQHIAEVIAPALNSGKIILCDRYADATEAYQGAARRIDSKIISDIHKIATEGLVPDLTILLDCPPEVGLERTDHRNAKDIVAQKEDRFEREEISFHKRVREGYLNISRRESLRVKVVDASHAKEVTHQEIIKVVENALREFNPK